MDTIGEKGGGVDAIIQTIIRLALHSQTRCRASDTEEPIWGISQEVLVVINSPHP